MPATDDALLARITSDPEVRFGKPCIRGRRITVQEILEWLSTGASPQQILADYPQLEAEDFWPYTPLPPRWRDTTAPPDEASVRRKSFAQAGRTAARSFS